MMTCQNDQYDVIMKDVRFLRNFSLADILGLLVHVNGN